MQSQDTTTLRAVVAELAPQLLPARFEKAQQPRPQALQLGFRTASSRLWLEVSWQADDARCHAILPPPRQGEGSTLAQQLQHSLGGLALVSLDQPPWERVLRLGFAPRPGEPLQRQLLIELMGRHSNVFLLDEQQQVIAAARQVRDHQSRWRPIGTGDPYSPPPPLAGALPDPREPLEDWRRRLSLRSEPIGRALLQSYRGLSPSLRDQLLVLAGLEEDPTVTDLRPDDWQRLHGVWGAWLACHEAPDGALMPWGAGYRCWRLPSEPVSTGGPLALNLALADYYERHRHERELRQRWHRLSQSLERLMQRERQELQRQQQLLQRADDEALLQRQADLLLCREDVGSLGHRRLQLDDPAGGPPLTVELDPRLTLVAQAQKLYQRARRWRRSVAAVGERLEHHRQRLQLLETSQLQQQLADPSDPEVLAALEEDLRPFQDPDGSGRRERKASGEPRPLELSSPTGLRLLVGRNHRQNDWISFRQARRGDLWFHAQEQPGSHVVLKGSEGTPEEADLAAAADLAAHFSRSHGSAHVPVVMVPVEQLQRIPGAPAGLVRHGGGRVLWGEPDRARALLPTLAP
jgi:predicted ribosome quality control (RQC) complex YloA/Tae2 family protein